jgi:hypothetical protein
MLYSDVIGDIRLHCLCGDKGFHGDHVLDVAGNARIGIPVDETFLTLARLVPQGLTSLERRRAMSEATDGTGAGLLDFLNWAGTRGEITPNTAKSIAVAVGKVLAVEADPSGVDVTNLDPEHLFGRFETLNRTGYTSHSMDTYRSRFFRGLSMYQAWLDKRSDWKSAGLRVQGKTVAVRSASTGKAVTKPRSKKPPAESETRSSAEVVEASGPSSAAAMVPYDLPLRPGLRVRLVLPEMLTQADAKRIAAFVNSLAFDQVDVTEEGG